DPLQLRGVPVLAEQVHLVALARERLGEARVVDVAARSREEIAVEDQDPIGATVLGASGTRARNPRTVFRFLAARTRRPLYRARRCRTPSRAIGSEPPLPGARRWPRRRPTRSTSTGRPG